jgi:hypothetical protein
MPVTAFQKEAVKPLRKPLDLEEADLNSEMVQEKQFVVALEHKYERIKYD